MEETILQLILDKCNKFIKSQIDFGRGVVFPCFTSENKDVKNPIILPSEIATTILWLFFVAEPSDITNQAIGLVKSQLNLQQETINFFLRSSIKKLSLVLPDDLETSAWAILTLKKFKCSYGRKLSQLIIETLDKNGNICLYPQPNKQHPQRKDCFSTIPILHFLKQEGFIENIVYKNNLDWIREELKQKGYKNGSRYYPSGLIFLFFLSLFQDILNSEDKEILKEAVLGEEMPVEVLELAIYATSCLHLGLAEKAKVAFGLLIKKNDFADGNFPCSALFQFGSNKHYIGSPTITAIFIAYVAKLFLEVEK